MFMRSIKERNSLAKEKDRVSYLIFPVILLRWKRKVFGGSSKSCSMAHSDGKRNSEPYSKLDIEFLSSRVSTSSCSLQNL